MYYTFTLQIRTTTDEADYSARSVERARLADVVTQLLEPMIQDRADRRLRVVDVVHLSTPDGLISIEMERDK